MSCASCSFYGTATWTNLIPSEPSFQQINAHNEDCILEASKDFVDHIQESSDLVTMLLDKDFQQEYKNKGVVQLKFLRSVLFHKQIYP